MIGLIRRFSRLILSVMNIYKRDMDIPARVGRGMMAVFCFDSDIVSQPRFITNVMSILFFLIIVMVEFIIVALEIR